MFRMTFRSIAREARNTAHNPKPVRSMRFSGLYHLCQPGSIFQTTATVTLYVLRKVLGTMSRMTGILVQVFQSPSVLFSPVCFPLLLGENQGEVPVNSFLYCAILQCQTSAGSGLTSPGLNLIP